MDDSEYIAFLILIAQNKGILNSQELVFRILSFDRVREIKCKRQITRSVLVDYIQFKDLCSKYLSSQNYRNLRWEKPFNILIDSSIQINHIKDLKKIPNLCELMIFFNTMLGRVIRNKQVLCSLQLIENNLRNLISTCDLRKLDMAILYSDTYKPELCKLATMSKNNAIGAFKYKYVDAFLNLIQRKTKKNYFDCYLKYFIQLTILNHYKAEKQRDRYFMYMNVRQHCQNICKILLNTNNISIINDFISYFKPDIDALLLTTRCPSIEQLPGAPIIISHIKKLKGKIDVKSACAKIEYCNNFNIRDITPLEKLVRYHARQSGMNYQYKRYFAQHPKVLIKSNYELLHLLFPGSVCLNEALGKLKRLDSVICFTSKNKYTTYTSTYKIIKILQTMKEKINIGVETIGTIITTHNLVILPEKPEHVLTCINDCIKLLESLQLPKSTSSWGFSLRSEVHARLAEGCLKSSIPQLISKLEQRIVLWLIYKNIMYKIYWKNTRSFMETIALREEFYMMVFPRADFVDTNKMMSFIGEYIPKTHKSIFTRNIAEIQNIIIKEEFFKNYHYGLLADMIHQIRKYGISKYTTINNIVKRLLGNKRYNLFVTKGYICWSRLKPDFYGKNEVALHTCENRIAFYYSNMVRDVVKQECSYNAVNGIINKMIGNIHDETKKIRKDDTKTRDLVKNKISKIKLYLSPHKRNILKKFSSLNVNSNEFIYIKDIQRDIKTLQSMLV